jgi:plastocyanin
MVHLSTVLSLVALYVSAAVAIPLPGDSALGDEVGVSAPNGVVMSDTEELNRNRMAATPYPSPWSGSMPSGTWSPPAPLPTEGSKDMSPPSYYPPKDGGDKNPPSYYPPKDEKDKNPPSGTPSSASKPEPSPTYGSGGNNWGDKSFDDCVTQCKAKFPMKEPPKDSPPSGTPTGTGKTHVVWVAPTQGVLRYVPFAVNASVGDTVKFIWGANNHTVTKGSQLTPCNKTSDSPFASGIQQKGFTYEQVVNDTNPLFYYCAFPNHCSKGMFGIINPPNALGAPSSVGSMMQQMVAANPDLAKMRAYTDNATKTSDAASRWGTNMDMAKIPQWAQESFMENVMYSRTFLAANPDAFKGGDVDASLGGNPPVIPQEITQVALGKSSGYGPGSSSSPSSVTSTSTVVPSPTGTSIAANLNGAASVTRSGMAAVLAALAAGFFLL